MKIKQHLLFLVFFFFLHPAIAQQRFTVNGYIRDAKTGEDLIWATFAIKELPGKGSATNAYGFYSITLPSGHYQITAQFVGYAPLIQQTELVRICNPRLSDEGFSFADFQL